jgi:hypothetical protein
MSKPLAALVLVVTLSLAIVLAQIVVAPTAHGTSSGAQLESITIQGIPTPRQLWQLTDADGAYVVPPGQILIITGVGRRIVGGNLNQFDISIDGVTVMGGYAPPDFLTYPTGYRVDPGESVRVSKGAVTLFGYLSSNTAGYEVKGIPTPRQIWNHYGYGGTYVVPNDKLLVLTGVTHKSSIKATAFVVDVDGVNVLEGHVPSTPPVVAFTAGCRVPPGSLVDIGPGMYFGYLAEL